jgi:hypothetical protein
LPAFFFCSSFRTFLVRRKRLWNQRSPQALSLARRCPHFEGVETCRL